MITRVVVHMDTVHVCCSAYFLADSYLKYAGWTLYDKASAPPPPTHTHTHTLIDPLPNPHWLQHVLQSLILMLHSILNLNYSPSPFLCQNPPPHPRRGRCGWPAYSCWNPSTTLKIQLHTWSSSRKSSKYAHLRSRNSMVNISLLFFTNFAWRCWRQFASSFSSFLFRSVSSQCDWIVRTVLQYMLCMCVVICSHWTCWSRRTACKSVSSSLWRTGPSVMQLESLQCDTSSLKTL